MTKPNVLVLTGYGINCEEETKFAFDMAGAKADIVHINDIIEKKSILNKYQIFVFPGGFSYGDDTGSGKAFANRIKNNMWEEVLKFVKGDKLVLGICNGFQILSELGFLPAFSGKYGEKQVALLHNTSATYECRWVDLKTQSNKSFFTKGIDRLHVPVAHGEGKFYTDKKTLSLLEEKKQVVFRYVKPDGTSAKGEFPYNPNGALSDIAGICDETGRILGMMPHPERHLAFTNREDWTLLKERFKRERKPLPKQGEGATLFKNAVKYFK